MSGLLAGSGRSRLPPNGADHDGSAGLVYVHDVSVEAMKEALEKLHFDGFELAPK
jgi:hypothetical protein